MGSQKSCFWFPYRSWLDVSQTSGWKLSWIWDTRSSQTRCFIDNLRGLDLNSTHKYAVWAAGIKARVQRLIVSFYQAARQPQLAEAAAAVGVSLRINQTGVKTQAATCIVKKEEERKLNFRAGVSVHEKLLKNWENLKQTLHIKQSLMCSDYIVTSSCLEASVHLCICNCVFQQQKQGCSVFYWLLIVEVFQLAQETSPCLQQLSIQMADDHITQALHIHTARICFFKRLKIKKKNHLLV